VTYAFLHGHPRKKGEALMLNVTGRGGTYPVLFRSETGTDTYPVRLDRMWFWPVIGPHPRVTSATPGFTVQVKRVDAGDSLY
jgi:hypothetical protein